MAIQNLFVRTKKQIGGIQLDAVLSETHNNIAVVTKNPIELGAEVTDHSYIEPKEISIVAEVSDNPLGSAAFGQIIDNVNGFFGSATTTNQTRSTTAYNAMVALMDARELLSVQTKLRLYDNMLITGLRTVQDKQTSRIARMVIDMQEIIITESQLVDIPAEQLESGGVRQQGASGTNRGRQQAKTPTDTTNKSVLKILKDWITDD